MKAKLVIVVMFAIVLIIISYLSFKDFLGNNDRPDKPQPKEIAQFETDKMKEDLALTPNQTDSIKAINLRFAQKAEESDKQQRNKENHHSIIKNLNKQKEADFARILSPEQFNLYKKNKKEERRQHLYEKLRNTPPPEKFAKEETEQMKEEFNLSSRQTAEVYVINLKYAAKIDTLINQEINKDVDNHEQMRLLRKQKTKELSKILTADQLKQYILSRMRSESGSRFE
jgi:hypothetical protein